MIFDAQQTRELDAASADLGTLADELPFNARLKAKRLEAKIAKGRRVGFGPLLIISIISLVVQLIRLWIEWKRKQEAK